MSGINNDQRHEYLSTTVRTMLERQMPPHQILATLEQENRSYCNPPLDRQLLIDLIQDIQSQQRRSEEKARAGKDK